MSWISGLQAGIAARGANSGEVWKLSAYQHRFHNAGLEAVQADDNHFFSQEADPELRSALRTVLGSHGGRRSGAAEFPYDFKKDANDLVPEDQQEAEHTGQPGSHRHHLVGTRVERQQFKSHEYSPDLFSDSTLLRATGTILTSPGSLSSVAVSILLETPTSVGTKISSLDAGIHAGRQRGRSQLR